MVMSVQRQIVYGVVKKVAIVTSAVLVYQGWKHTHEKPSEERSSSSLTHIKHGGDDLTRIGNMCYVAVRNFYDNIALDIREYSMMDNGQLEVGKYGVDLNLEQYNNLKKVLPLLEKKLTPK